MRRQLDERPVRGLEHVGPVVVHEGRVVPEPVLDEKVEGPLARLPARRAVAVGPHAHPLERRESTLEVGSLRGLAEVERRAVGPAVVRDLVAGRGDPLHRLGVALGGHAGNEEGGRQRVVGEEVEEPRYADERPVRLVAHRGRVLRVPPALDEDRRLGVDVEAQDRERRGVADPAHRAIV